MSLDTCFLIDIDRPCFLIDTYRVGRLVMILSQFPEFDSRVDTFVAIDENILPHTFFSIAIPIVLIAKAETPPTRYAYFTYSVIDTVCITL